MEKQTVTVHNESGLHARPAAVFAAAAKQFQSKVTVNLRGKSINGKSIVSLLSAGISKGTAIELVAEGVDEKESLTALVKLVEAGCGENAVPADSNP